MTNLNRFLKIRIIPDIKFETIFCKPNPIPTDKAPTKIVSEDKSIPTDFKPKTKVTATKNSILNLKA